MLAIAFRFPARRYHATPWGHHVNEAEVEWPPSPWRILRALIATWHRKADPSHHPEDTLQALIERMAASLPAYRLPAAVRAHTRHYMPTRKKPTLVFDAFVHLHPVDELVAVWPEVELPDDARELLGLLLRDLGYLGRAESWVDASLRDDAGLEPNCVAGEEPVDRDTGELTEPVRLITPLAPDQYQEWQTRSEAETDWGTMRPRERRILRSTLPRSLFGALQLDTSAIQAAGWSQPPGSAFVTYQRPYGSLAAQSGGTPPPRRVSRSSARLALAGRPLPRIEDAVRIAELVRAAAMSRARHLFGEHAVPSELSGHDLPAGNRHGHAFYLPEDDDGDGRIDHVLIHASDGLSAQALDALAAIERLWERDGQEWQVLFESSSTGIPAISPYLTESRRWISVTPYLHPWFRKKGFGVPEQVTRECTTRGLPAPASIRSLERIVAGRGRARRPVHFRRFRRRPGLVQPDTKGSFLEVEFLEPVRGPIALGFGCHFGLGLFRPE